MDADADFELKRETEVQQRIHESAATSDFDKQPLLKRINWVHAVLLTSTPVLAVYGLATTKLTLATLAWAVVYYFMTGLGITGGYHRYWSHRSYQAAWPLRMFWALMGAGAVEGSILWWCRDHRVHHRYTDTDQDPYSAHKGLWHSHMGWMLVRKDRRTIGHADISDLLADKIVMWQHHNYLWLSVAFGALFPMAVAGLGWGDWRGGFFVAGICRLVFVHHSTFCVNSLAHYLGEQTYDDRRSPRDHFITALVTLGEGWHCFHHEFPQDFRNGLRWYHYDPTKWTIALCSYLGLSYKLKRFPQNEIEKGCLQMQEKKIEQLKQQLNWGIPVDKLPVFTLDELKREVKDNGKQWIAVGGIIHDVTQFIDEHPGGKKLVRAGLGKDMTKAFNGGVYNHSNAARNLLSTMRVGVLAASKQA